MAEFEDACEKKGLGLFVLPPKSPQMNGAVERCNGAWRYEFTPSTTCRDPWRRSIQSSTASSTSTTITDHTEPLAEEPHPTTLHNEQPMRPTRLICHEPGQSLD